MSLPQSIIIVGAGMAGIKIAHRCMEENPSINICIIESNDYIGGRMRNFDFEGHTVEMGANWISGLETIYDNPVWKLAKDVGLDGHFIDRAEDKAINVFDSDGNDISKDYMEAMDRFDGIYEKAVKACAERGIDPKSDTDIRSFLESFGWIENDLSNIERAIEFNMLEVWVCDNLSQCSVAHNFEEGANDIDLGKDEFFVEDQRGFNCILNTMVKEIKEKGATIKLNANVQKVQYLPGDSKVTAKNTKTGEITEYKADTVVSTVSLGVLQSNKIEFKPPFPKWKETAINEIKMHVFSKVYAVFKDNFWGNKNEFVICTNKKDYYPLWMKYRNTDEDNNIFMCYLGGDEAKRVESLPTEEIKDEIEELFKKAYGKKLISEEGYDDSSSSSNIFRPIAVAVTDWSKNSNFCGSYSQFPVHAYSKVSYDNLRRGLTGTPREEEEDQSDGQKGRPITLYFAGEGYDDKFHGWVQGAYRSGERVAKSILQKN